MCALLGRSESVCLVWRHQRLWNTWVRVLVECLLPVRKLWLKSIQIKYDLSIDNDQFSLTTASLQGCPHEKHWASEVKFMNIQISGRLGPRNDTIVLITRVRVWYACTKECVVTTLGYRLLLTSRVMTLK